MKKSLLKVVGALALVSTIFFASCSDITYGDMSSDSDTKLATPKVTAVSYPGVIVASWTEVPDATGYEVQVLEDGIECDVYTVPTANNNTYLIAPTVNGIEYTFRVVARSSSSPARAITVFDSKYGEAKAKAIVPPAGTTALNLAAYEGGYDGKAKTTKDVLTGDKIRVTKDGNNLYVSIQAKCYLKYEIDVVDNYGVVTNAVSATADNISKNDSWIEKKLSVTSEGTYSVVVKATAIGNSSLYPADKVPSKETYTYTTVLNGAVKANTTVSASYVDNIRSEGEAAKNAVRVSWTPAEFEGKPAAVDMYKVYRRTAYSNELVEVTSAGKEATETEPAVPAVLVKVTDLTAETSATSSKYDSVKYYVDTEVADATIAYTYYVVLTKDDSIANAPGTLSPKAADYVALATTPVAGSVLNTKAVTDVTTNDIEWTITLENKYQKFAAYALKKDWSNSKGYNTTPYAEDFDTTTDLASKATTTDDVVYTLVQADVEEGKHFLLVVFSEEGKRSKKYISSAMTVTAAGTPSIAANSIATKVYDNTINAVTSQSYEAVNDDLILTFTDTIDLTKETIDTYSYELYKAVKTINEANDGTAIYTITGAFTKVEGFVMECNDTPSSTLSNTSKYVGIYTEDDMEAGSYVYKVVKTNKATKKYDLQTVDVTITDSTKQIPFVSASFMGAVHKDSENKWVAGADTAATKTNRIKIDLSGFIKETYWDYQKDGATAVKSVTDLSAGVTYELYRTELIQSGAGYQTTAVYTLLDTAAVQDTEVADASKVPYSTAKKYDTTTSTWEYNDPVDYVTVRQFNMYDSTVSTTADVSYSYVLKVSKEGYEDLYIPVN